MNWKKRKKRNRILRDNGLHSWTIYQMMLRMCSEAEYLKEMYGASIERDPDAMVRAMFMIRSKYTLKARRQRLKKDIRNKRIGTGNEWWRFDKYCEFMISMGCSESLYKG